MKKIRFEVYHGGDDNMVVDLTIEEIEYNDSLDYMNENKVGYDSYEYIS